jgi:hypothetical protein
VSKKLPSAYKKFSALTRRAATEYFPEVDYCTKIKGKYVKCCKEGVGGVLAHSFVLSSVASGAIEDRKMIIFLSSSTH